MIGPNEITRTNWLGVFGMTEMEEAAKVILAKSQVAGQWVPCYLDDMKTEMEQTGFIELVFNGWMRKAKADEPWTYNGGFLPEDGFIERLLPTPKKV